MTAAGYIVRRETGINLTLSGNRRILVVARKPRPYVTKALLH